MKILLRTLWYGIPCWLCSFRGHDELLEFEPGRMFLRCASCGHTTQGWEVGVAQSAPHFNRATERVQRSAQRFAREHQAA
jgi:hypothetical protein